MTVVQGFTSNAKSGKTATVLRTEPAREEINELMRAVRNSLYKDNKEPEGWNSGRDVSIIKALLKCGYILQAIHDAIRGVVLLREAGAIDWLPPGEGCSLRVLYANNGARPLWAEASAAYYRHQNTGQSQGDPGARRKRGDDSAPQSIGEIMGQAS